MSAEIVNLRRARKDRLRRECREKAQQNRAAFGRPRRDREQAEAEQRRAARFLDGARREPSGKVPGGGSGGTDSGFLP